MKPYYEHGGVTLYLGDCVDVLPSITGDVVVSDPPYNAKKNYGATTNDKMEWTDWVPWFDERLVLMAAAAPDVLAFLSQTAWKKYTRLGQREIDWTLVWNKPLSLAVCAMPFMPHWEPIAYWGKTRKKKGGAFWGSDVITCNVHKDVDWHPTPKPEPLMLELVGKFKGTVIDPFAGSGTTLWAAKQLGMKAIGIEINEGYCEGIAKRLSQEMLPMNIRRDGAA